MSDDTWMETRIGDVDVWGAGRAGGAPHQVQTHGDVGIPLCGGVGVGEVVPDVRIQRLHMGKDRAVGTWGSGQVDVALLHPLSDPPFWGVGIWVCTQTWRP